MSADRSEKPPPDAPDGPIVVRLADGGEIRIDLDVRGDVHPAVPTALTATFKQLAESVGRWEDDPRLGVKVMQSTADFGDLIVRGLDRPRAHYEKLPKRRRHVVMMSVADIAETLAEAALLENIEVKDLADRARVASDTFRLITKASPDQFEALSDAIAPIVELDPAETSDEDAEAAGRLLMRQLQERIIRQSYSVRELAELGLSRQRLNQLRKDERLFAIQLPYRRSFLYPRWQFDRTFKPKPEMPELIAAAQAAGLEPIDLHVLMTNVEAGDGVSPVELLDNGQHELVMNIIGAANAHGS